MTIQEGVSSVASGHSGADVDTAVDSQERRQFWILLVTMAGTFLALLDSFIVNVAIPSIQRDLGANLAEIQLIVGGYTLVYGLLLITGGRLGDIRGYRPTFIVGVLVFIVASAACALASSPGALIAFRVAQGVGAALFYPQVLSILQTAFSGRRRTMAFGVFGATIGLASIAGQVLGGILTSADLFGLGWRTIFLINVPVGLLAVVGAWRVLPRTRSDSPPRLDLVGSVIVSVALGMLVLPLVIGREIGWPVWTTVLLAASVPALIGYVAWENRVARRGGDPLTDPALFRSGPFAAGSGIALAFFSGNAALFLLLTLELQTGLGMSALGAGLVFVPLSAAFMISSVVAPRLTPRFGNGVLTFGYVLNAAGTALLIGTSAVLGPDLTGPAMIPSLILIGFGQGLGVSPLLGAVLSAVPPREAGAASGVMETLIQIAMSLGIAVIGLIFFTLLGPVEGVVDPAHATRAFTLALIANLVVALIAIPLTRRLPPMRRAGG
ncbi:MULTISPECIES: MFS transporter [Actinoalloteichus]|uniref:Major Facilitator Superfamily transporter n=1 Tax=Actinoalloteichus fjordicus TaxID=1612552 RepID=A0AAC9LD91_9PSEU|nr:MULTISPECIES: MFS transporter [Actinoalloteichus]APU14552.1 Major Facilitator Superfamily transporter [Actinoalloteichus fjordicus]APU20520.1 Major Facilitator Superfamily transporter [Actinoalloteichus sp. GBA129-24]